MGAKIILDSISPAGHRLTTMEVVMHRFILAEFNTHRVFSRNSASSRAIPVKKRIAAIRESIAMPIEWGLNQPGMQAGPALDGLIADSAAAIWRSTAEVAIAAAEALEAFGIHKQVTNRLLEPFLWHTVIVSSTEWDNFFKQRCSPLAQPEIRIVAEEMRNALNESIPNRLEVNQWHTPYILPDEYDLPLLDRIKISSARCARVSYLTHDGQRDHGMDLDLYRRLSEADPPHWSPLEHVATPDPFLLAGGNFRGWMQWRQFSNNGLSN